MDGENNGKPYEQMDDSGGFFPLFSETSMYVISHLDGGEVWSNRHRLKFEVSSLQDQPLEVCLWLKNGCWFGSGTGLSFVVFFVGLTSGTPINHGRYLQYQLFAHSYFYHTFHFFLVTYNVRVCFFGDFVEHLNCPPWESATWLLALCLFGMSDAGVS